MLSPSRFLVGFLRGGLGLSLLVSTVLFASACHTDDVLPSDGPIALDQTPGRDGGHDLPLVFPDLGDDVGVVPGDPTRLLVRGTIVTPTEVLPAGEVLISGHLIVCVAASCTGEPDAAGATVINTGGIVFPGLIDGHNHTQYNYLPRWQHTKLFKNHNQWQADSGYDTFIDPHRTLDGTLMCEMVKYGEIRSLIAGTTMMQGTPLRKCADTLVRNADLPYNGVGDDRVRTNVLGIGTIDATDVQKLKDVFADGSVKAYMLHLSEGIDETARKEFDILEGHGLLVPQVSIIHGTALGMPELTKIKNAGMNIVWSPSSNIDLYGQTNDIAMVKNLGIPISISPDWTPSGDPNLLDELRTVKKLDQEQLGKLWSDKELVEMVTTQAAKAVGFGDELGSLVKGKHADLMVVTGDRTKPYEALLAAKLTAMRLVIVKGKALYGDPVLLGQLAPNEYCESVTICGAAKTICVKEAATSSDKLDQSLTDIQNTLTAAYPGVLTLSTNCN